MNNAQKKSLRIGLTGGIASGKSTVAGLFAKLDIQIISADSIARELMHSGSPLLKQVVQAFGDHILDVNDELDRKQLREIIFENALARKKLNSITHPVIRQALVEKANSATSPYIVLEIPLLVESGLQLLVDRILVVDITTEQQIQRIITRDQCSREHAENILKSQSSAQERLLHAHDVLHNNGGLNKLEQQVRLLDKKYLQLSRPNKSNSVKSTSAFDGLDLH